MVDVFLILQCVRNLVKKGLVFVTRAVLYSAAGKDSAVVLDVVSGGLKHGSFLLLSQRVKEARSGQDESEAHSEKE